MEAGGVALDIIETNPAADNTTRGINRLLVSNLPNDGNIKPLMDLTGVSKGLPPYPEPGYGKAITLISPIHFVTCKHWNIRNAGDSVDFSTIMRNHCRRKIKR